MKLQPLKLAGIVAVMFGGVTSIGVGAIEQDSPAVAVGSVMAPDDAMAASSDAVPAADPADVAVGSVTAPDDAIAASAPAPAVEPADVAGDTDRAQQKEVVASASDWPPALTTAQLDTMRGGFDLPTGLKVSFGIDRVAFVNGTMVSSSSINIPDISTMTAQQAQALAAANTSALVQVGQGNSVQPGALPGLTGGVIQNTLNNQQIQELTTINTTVNSLGAFKSMNIGSTLSNALISAVRPR